MSGFFLLILAVAVSTMAIPLAMRLAPHIGMVDHPDPRKVHRQPVPRVGGWGIIAGCLLPLCMIHFGDPALRAYLAGSLVLFVFGAWDDARQIGHWPKFAGQLLAAAIPVYWADLYVTRLPFVDGAVMDPAVGKAFTMFAMIGVINAINHSDGLDGLAGGEVLLSLLAIAFLGQLSDSALVTGIALAAIGGTVGFLRYNTHPARVFMGDSGSQFLGFTVAFLVIYLVQVVNPAASAALPLLLLGLPIADILVVFYKRASGRMNWFKATRNHVHHRLLDLGFTHFQSVVTIYSLQALLVSSAVLLRYRSDALVVAVYLGVVVSLFAVLAYAERTGWHTGAAVTSETGHSAAWMRRSWKVPTSLVLLAGIAISVSLLCLFAALWAQEIPQDFGVVAGVLAVILLLAALPKLGTQPLALRLCTYIAATFAAWLFIHYPRTEVASLSDAATIVIVALALAVVLFVRFGSSGRRFGTTPTDYLIGFAALALLFWRTAAYGAGDDRTAQFVAYAIVLFYGCEVVIGHLGRWRFVLGGSAFTALLIVALRGLIGMI